MKVVIALLLCVAPDNHDRTGLAIRDAQREHDEERLEETLREIDYQPFSYLGGWYASYIQRQWDIKWLQARGHATYHLTPFLDRSHE